MHWFGSFTESLFRLVFFCLQSHPWLCLFFLGGIQLTVALIIFIITYILMLALQKYRPFIALGSALIYIILGTCGMFDMSILSALKAVDYNVLLMIGGTMGTVTLFVESKMPARLSELLISNNYGNR